MTLHAGQQIHKHLIDCHQCGFVHWHPLPDASTVAELYEGDNFYAGESPHSPPDWFLKERGEWDAGLWDSYYAYLASFLDEGKMVLDIGAGCGWFVAWLNYRYEKYGWPSCGAWGIEPSQSARQYSPYNLHLIPNMEQAKYILSGVPSGNIVLMLTLEHILDPETWLREEVLPHLDGRLVVVVPNEFNGLQRQIIERETELGASQDCTRFALVDRQTKREYVPWFVSSVHLNYFTPDSLRGLLERVGLQVTFTGGTFPTELWPLIGLDHRKDPAVGRKTHLWRLKLEKRFPWLFHVYGWLMRRRGIGREIIMVAERK